MVYFERIYPGVHIDTIVEFTARKFSRQLWPFGACDNISEVCKYMCAYVCDLESCRWRRNNRFTSPHLNNLPLKWYLVRRFHLHCSRKYNLFWSSSHTSVQYMMICACEYSKKKTEYMKTNLSFVRFYPTYILQILK